MYLLELHREAQTFCRFPPVCRRISSAAVRQPRIAGVVRVPRQNDFPEEIKERRFHRRIPSSRPRNRLFEERAVARRPAAGVDVGPIHGEAGHHFGDDVAQGVEREVARSPVAVGNLLQAVREHVQFARHSGRHDQPLALIHLVLDRLRAPAQLGVGTADASHLRLVDEDPVEVVEIVVAGRPRHRPSRRQRLASGQDLLGDDVEPLRCEILEHVEVARGIEQPVGMIDSNRVNLSFGHQARQELMRRGKHLGVFDAQTCERVHIEKAAIVDLMRCRPPVPTSGTPALRADRAAHRSCPAGRPLR